MASRKETMTDWTIEHLNAGMSVAAVEELFRDVLLDAIAVVYPEPPHEIVDPTACECGDGFCGGCDRQ